MELVFAIVYASTFVRSSIARPINETEPSWGPEPQVRGTLSILLTCLITLSLCVWTAIHLNVNPEPTKRRLFLFKWVWLLMGMFTPEIVLWCAINQFLEARKIRETVLQIRRKRLGISQPSCAGFWQEQWANFKRRCAILKRPFQKKPLKDDQENGPHLLNFSMGSAFFVVMGGYVVHPAPGEFDGIPVTLTPRGFILLYAQDDMIKEEQLDPRLIADKTKADGLAKLIVCIQALWLVIQGIGRKATGLPLPLLELHTIMHVLCAVAMYWFWWDKPLDVRFPIILDLEQHVAEEIYSSYKFRDHMRPFPTHDQTLSGAPSVENNRQDELGGTVTRTSSNRSGAQTNKTDTKAATYRPHERPTTLQNNKVRNRLSRHWVRLKEDWGWRIAIIFPIVLFWEYRDWHKTFELWPPASEELTDVEIRLARLRKMDGVAQPFEQSQTVLNRPANNKLKPLCTRARMIQHTGLLRNGFKGNGLVSWEAFLILGCLSVLYGGAHAGAWNTHLPSSVERLLWRLSSVIAGTFLPSSMALFFFAKAVYYMFISFEDWTLYNYPQWHSSKNWVTELVLAAALYVLLGLATIYVIASVSAFIFARTFLVVESFISLRSLPKGSFKTVPWSNYWPHF